MQNRMKGSRKIRTRILLYFVPVSVLSIVAVMIVAFITLTASGLSSGRSSLEKSVTLIARQVDDSIRHIKYNVKAFSTTAMLQDALMRDYSIEANPTRSFLNQVRNSISSIIDVGDFASSMVIVAQNGMTYHYPGSFVTPGMRDLEADWYRHTIAQNGVMVIHDLEESGDANLLIQKSIIHIETGRCIGAMQLKIRESAFSDIFADVNSEANGEYFIINGHGTILSSADKTSLFSSVQQEEYFRDMDLSQARIYRVENAAEMLVGIAPVSETDWYVVGMVAKSVITRQNRTFFQTVLFLGIIFILVTTALAVTLARRITRPLGDLLQFTQRVSAGEFDAQMLITSKDEIGQLSQSFNRMVRDIKDLTYKIWLEQRQKRDYALDFMQAQINPHLLYNSISGINYLITSGEYEGASSALRHLGSYYRKVLKKDSTVTVADDIELTADYLVIQQRVHPGLFEFIIDIEPSLLSCPILKLTLQPILENSILHGLMGYGQNGQIEVIGYRSQGCAAISVFDNGRGFSVGEWPENRDHFALRNVDERLKLKFGGRYGLKIESNLGVGTLVTVFIPDTL